MRDGHDRARGAAGAPAPEPAMGRMAGEVGMVLRGGSRTHRFLRARLTFLVCATLLVDAVASVLVYAFEHGRPGSAFADPGTAVFWVSAQLTTVSSQLPDPETWPARVVEVGLDAWAITVAATLAASLAAFFRARHVERP
jgi:hypothetical protein